jgi:Dolichyl-phosphate-mannose-protein mannosyltransferase
MLFTDSVNSNARMSLGVGFMLSISIFVFSSCLAFLGVGLWPFSVDAFIFLAVIFGYISATYMHISDRSIIRRSLISYAPYLLLCILAVLALDGYFNMLSGFWRSIFCACGIVFGLISLQKLRLNDVQDLSQSHDVEYATKKINKRLVSIITALAGAALLFVYLWHISLIKFIDSDEIRLLYDARLIWQGLIPFHDFSARSPALIYFLAAVHCIAGNAIQHYYIVSAFFFWLSVIALYFLGKHFLTRLQAVLLSGVYALMPITLNSLYIKTETFEIFFVLISIIFFVYSLERKSLFLRSLSHLSMIIALFIRPSAEIFYAFHAVILFMDKDRANLFKRFRNFGIEVICVCALFVSVTYMFFTTYNGLFYTNIWKSFGIDADSIDRLRLTRFFVPLPMMIMAAISFLGFFMIPGLRRIKLLMAAVASMTFLAIGYLGNAVVLGFWPQYYMEFSFTISILFVYTAVLISKSVPNQSFFIIAFIVITFSSFIPDYISLNAHLGYYNIDSVMAVSRAIQSKTSTSAVIFGGNPIFAYSSGRGQFMHLSHSYYDSSIADKVIASLRKNPPDAIVDDGYLESSYAWKSGFQDLLTSCYQRPDILTGSGYDRSWSISLYWIEDECRKK